MKKMLALGAAALLWGTAAGAVTIDLAGSNNSLTSADGSTTATFAQDGITGTITAGCDSCSNPVTDLSNSGLGVKSSGDADNSLDSKGKEWLSFAFDAPVEFVKIVFGSWDNSSDMFEVVLDAVSLATDNTSSYTFANDTTGEVLEILAVKKSQQGPQQFNFYGYNNNYNNNNNNCYSSCSSDSKFRIASIEVNAIAPVPLPAGGVLLLTALGGLAAARRRKSA